MLQEVKLAGFKSKTVSIFQKSQTPTKKQTAEVQLPAISATSTVARPIQVLINTMASNETSESLLFNESKLLEAPWPMFGQNPQHTSQSPYLGAQTEKVKWGYQIASHNWGAPSPIIDEKGSIYIGSDYGYLYAFSPEGVLEWEYKTEGVGLSSAAISSSGVIYFGSGDRYLYALNSDGTLRWKYQIDGNVGSSPVIGNDGTIYIGSGDGYLYAINKDGILKWKYKTDWVIWHSSPALGNDETIYIGTYTETYGGYLYAINSDGTLKWKFDVGYYNPTSPSIAPDGTIYLNNMYLYALNPDGSLKWKQRSDSRTTPAIEADGTIHTGKHAFYPDGTLKWESLSVKTDMGSLAIGSDGTIYVGTRDPSSFYAINKDGTVKWKYELPYHPDGFINAPEPTIGADGTVYVVLGDGVLYAFGPGSADTTPPSDVTDLIVGDVTTDSVTLTWTAPGDDGNVGTATTYDIRYSTSPITETNWGSAIQVTGEPAPKMAGTPETFAVTGLLSSTTYYLALKTADEVPNWSGFSNITSVTTTGPNQPPVASFTWSPESPFYSGDVVTFDASASFDPDGTIVQYLWDFGDGFTAEGKIVTHRFRGAMDEPKTYNVSLTVKDDQGATGADRAEVLVKPLNKTVEVTHVPSSLPVTEPYARMTVSYNWVDTANGEDIYMVSRIGVSSGGFTGYYSFFILDAHSGPKPLVIWWDLLPSGVGEIYASPFPSHVPSFFSRLFPNYEPRSSELRFYGEDFFEGFVVHGSDVMNIRATGWPAGIQIGTDPIVVMLKMLSTTFFEENSAYFAPERVEEPHIPIDINDFNLAHLGSPGELRVYDSQGRVTGLVGGEVKEEIPNSTYSNDTVLIISPDDPYHYEMAGTEDGGYSLAAVSAEQEEFNVFTAVDIPTSRSSIHQYDVDWDALSRGEDGVTLQVDNDGDGVFEHTLTADNDLTYDEFIFQINDPPWISPPVPNPPAANFNQNIVMTLTTYEHDIEDTSASLNWTVSQYDSNAIKEIQGENSANDTLTFVPKDGYSGTTSITLRLTDSGNLSAEQSNIQLTWNPDTTPPDPNPMTWKTVPYAIDSHMISMEATTATDTDSPPVQYQFNDKPWQSEATFSDTNLTANTEYCYTVKARDSAATPNETQYSEQKCATTPPEVVNVKPEIDAIDNQSVDEGQILEFTVTAHDDNPGDIVTLSASNLPPFCQISENTAGNPASIKIACQPDYRSAGTNKNDLSRIYSDITFTATDNASPPLSADPQKTNLTVNNISIFTDVPVGYWAYGEIEALYNVNIVSGYGDTYRPTEPVTRAQMAVFIARAVADGDANVPDGPMTPSFPDVPRDYWAYKYIEFCKAKNIVQGYFDGYRPETIVSRDQMAVFIARAFVCGDANVPDGPETPTFNDVSTDFWAYKYIEFLVSNNIVKGYWDNTYRPDLQVTRDQMAVFIYRAFLENHPTCSY